MADPADEKARLSGARGEFVASLGRRLQTLRQALRELEDAPNERSRRDSLLRRVHALGAAARVLGFASVAEALQEAERALAERQRPRTKDLAEVSRVLDVLPSLVWGAPQSLRPARPPSAAPEELAGRQWPLSLVLYGGEDLAVTLTRAVSQESVEFQRAAEVEDACRAARVLGPDLVVVDADHADARVFLERLAADELAEPVSSIVLGEFSEPERIREYTSLGATRILKKPCNPETLRRTIEELSEAAQQRRVSHARALGNVTLPALTKRIQAEVQRGLLDAAVAGAQNTHVALGEGTDVMAAVWGALTRVRELVTLHSNGQIRFEPTGPEGAIPVAPWTNEERRAGERAMGSTRDEADVPLAGRTVVVADDDPAVAWFLSGLLKSVGAEVVEAHDGFKALELARQGWPDLVVSDILMPGLDGFALCRELKHDVAVRDVPVILLSWKEDLLQRVRELGAGADGYLRKEAAASTVVQRIREVMRPRARVEARLKQGGEVRGRLDGLTPRLVLELCCASQANLRVEVVDAFYRYELHVRRGQLVAARRVAQGSEASESAGVDPARVVSSLLGVNAGRFLVVPDDSAVKSDFSGSLKEVLKPAVDRARVVQAALASDRLAAVTRIHFVEEELNTYLAATPDPMKTALLQLVGGMTPRQLLLGGISPDLLERALGDVARRGCITHVEGPPGPERQAEERGVPPAAAPAAQASAQPAGPQDAKARVLNAAAPLASAREPPVAAPPPAPEPPEASAAAPAPAAAAPLRTPSGPLAKLGEPPATPAPDKETPAEPPRGPPHKPLRKPPDKPVRASMDTAGTAPEPAKGPPPAPARTRAATPLTALKTEPEVKESTQLDPAQQAAAKAAFSFQLSPEPPPASVPPSFEEVDDGAWFVSDSSLDAEQVNPPWPPESGTLPGVGEKKLPPEEVETRTPPPARSEAAPGTEPSPRTVPGARPKTKVSEAGPPLDQRHDSAPDLASAIGESSQPAPRRRARLTTQKSAMLPETKPISFPKAQPAGETKSPTQDATAASDAKPADAAPELGATLLLGEPTPPPKPRVRQHVGPPAQRAAKPAALEPEPGATPEPKAEPEAKTKLALDKTALLEPAESPAAGMSESVAKSPEPAPSAEAAPSPSPVPSPSPAPSPEVAEPAEALPEPAPGEAGPAAASAPREATGSEAEAAYALAEGQARREARQSHDGDEQEAPRALRGSPPPSPVPSSVPASPKRPAARPSLSPFRFGGVGLGVVVVASAAASYLLVRSAVDWLGVGEEAAQAPAAQVAEPPHEPVPPSAAPAATQVPMTSELSAPAAKVEPKPEASEAPEASKANVSINEEALPSGMELGAGKGVLKIVTPGAHAIYVDGEFAGRGPVRIVPLPPGKHQVKIRAEGEENSYTADVKAGRLTRFALGAD